MRWFAVGAVMMLAAAVVQEPLAEHLQRVKALHEADLAAGFGAVYLPDALGRKLPGTANAWVWQYVVPSARRSADRLGGTILP
jgi:hypothetical protein